MAASIKCSISRSHSQDLRVLSESLLINLLLFIMTLFYILFWVCSYGIAQTSAVNSPHKKVLTFEHLTKLKEREEETQRSSLICSIDPHWEWGCHCFVSINCREKNSSI